MIGYFIDFLKSKKENKEDITVDESNDSMPIESDEKPSEEVDKKPKCKKTRKLKTRRHRGMMFFIASIIIVAMLLPKLILLNTGEEYELTGTLHYVHSKKAYRITYEIEDLNNYFRLKEGQDVCIPYYYTSFESAVTESTSFCIPGKITSTYRNRVKIEYKDLPKYISFDELFLYLDKTKISKNTVVGKVNIKIKYFYNNYQLTNIYPKKEET